MKEVIQASQDLLAALGTMSDFKVAATFGVRPYQVRDLRVLHQIPTVHAAIERSSFDWAKKRLALLGTMADERLAYHFKVTSNVISKQGIKLNIPIWTGHKGTWANPEAVAKLGTMPDPMLAKQLGITASAVFCKRKALGIPAFIPSSNSGQRL
jgi:hypothetical protein